MLIKEFRIIIPMTVDEYQIGQLYTIQKKSRIESVGHGSGVEIIENRPYETNNEKGQYTLKVFHVDERLPAALKTITKLLFPKSALTFEEESWNSYPYTRTKYKHKLFKSFNIDIESKYLPDLGQTGNAFNLNKSELACRTVDFIDIVNDTININEYKSEEDPSIYHSMQTKRGPLQATWLDELKQQADTNSKITYMCVYKLCRIECAFWGCQSRVEKLISDSVLRHTILITHRQAWCWQDEYYHLTIEDVRKLEAETQRYLSMKMNNSNELKETKNISRSDESLNVAHHHINYNTSSPKVPESKLKSPKANISPFSSSNTITATSSAKNSPGFDKRMSLTKTNQIAITSNDKHEYAHKIASNFVKNISFESSNTEEFFDYVEDDTNSNNKKDELEFNLKLLNNKDDENCVNADVVSQSSNYDEFYDAISQVSFNLSTNTTESGTSSLFNRSEQNSLNSNTNQSNIIYANDLSKKPALSLKSCSSSGLIRDNDVHKCSSLGSLPNQRHSSSPTKTLNRPTNLSKIDTLVIVVHGGNITCTDASKTTDFNHFKSTMESMIRNHYSSFNERIAYRLVSCEPICKEALIMLSTLSPIAASEPVTSWKENDNFAEHSAEAFTLNENLPFSTIPLLLSANQVKYKENLSKFVRQCNKVYNEFLSSAEGNMFHGQVVLIGDSVGSLLVYDSLCLNTTVFSNFDESSSSSSIHNYSNDHNNNKTNDKNSTKNREPKKPNSTSPSPSPTTNRYPLINININDTNADLVEHGQEASSSSVTKKPIQVQRCNSSLSNSSGIEFNASPYLTPPSPTLTPTLMKSVSCEERLEFEVNHFFVFGSPLGLVLAARKLSNKTLEIPSCTQLYNLFHLTDPVATRIEPLLCKQFKFLQPCMVPRYLKYPMGDGSNLSLDHFIVKFGHLFETNLLIDNSANGSDDKNVYLTPNFDQLKSLQKIIQTKKEWWGDNRIDYVLYAPDRLTYLPKNSLPYLFHSCFWESQDVIAFILRMILKTDSGHSLRSNEQTSILKSPNEPVEKWQRRFNRMKLRNLSANHRANDVIVLEDKEQVLSAKFSYGPLDFALSGEKIDIFISNSAQKSNGEYQFYASELTDSHGKIKYELPLDKRLPLGIYQVKMIVKCDHTYVEFYMAVLPASTEAVVFSIDGSFAANISFSGTDPKVRAGAVDVVRYWQDLGYLIIYITARPDMQHYKVTNWLAQHNFPLGLVFFSDGLRRDPIKQKSETLRNLVTNNSLILQAAYGSAKDIPMYANLGVNTNRIFITGKSKSKYLNQAIMLKDGYASHLAILQNPNTGSRQAQGNARLIIKKSNFNNWHNQLAVNSHLMTQVSRESADFLTDPFCHSVSQQQFNTISSNVFNNTERSTLSKLYSLPHRSKNPLK